MPPAVRSLAAGLLLGCSCLAWSQSASAQQGAEEQGSPFRPLRYEEDWSALRDPSKRSDPLDQLKYISLGYDPHYLTLGGDWRERFQAFSPANLGLPDGSDRSGLLHRLLLHADLHMSPHFRAFAQLGNHEAIGKRGELADTDRDRLDLQQGFIDLRLEPAEGSALTLRGGRQEMQYGSSRLVGVREAPNVRLSFDGLRLGWEKKEARLDVFAVRTVRLRAGVFDDVSEREVALWGLYGTTPAPLLEGLTIDIYYLGYNNDAATFGGVAGGERRHTVGGRFSGDVGPVDYNFEGAYQFGSFRDDVISAFTLASDTSLTLFEGDPKPKVGIKANVASGDRRPDDGRLGTFNPLFPRGAYFTEAGYVAPANFFDLDWSIEVEPTPELTLALNWDVLWRASRQDAFYSLPLDARVPGDASRARRIGSQVQLLLTWRVTPRVTLKAGVVHFDAGPVLRDGGMRSSNFGLLQTALRF